MHSNSCAVLAAIAQHAELTPQAPALIESESGSTLNYCQLWSQIGAISDRLQDAGIGPRARVAVLLPPGRLQVLVTIGALYRHAAIPLQSKTTVAELEGFLGELAVSALIASPEFSTEADLAIAMGLVVLIARDDESPIDWQIRYPSSQLRRPAAGSEAILYLITSATTGTPKIVPLSSTNLEAGSRATCDSLQLMASDRLLLIISLCHRNGVENLFAQLQVGGAVIITNGFDPVKYLHWLDDLKTTWYIGSPTVHQSALGVLKSALRANAGTLRFVQSSGAPLPSSVRDELEGLLHVPVLNAYGATEAHHIAVEAFPLCNRMPGSVGRSCGLEINIIDSLGISLSPGEEGEILVRGPAVIQGYADSPEIDLTAFHEGWFRSGDLGRLDLDGNLFVTGRIKEMINRGGEKVAPSEVDSVLASHPAVLEAAAFSIPHPTLGEDVACAVVLRPEHSASVTTVRLRQFAAERLPRFKVPRKLLFVQQIPKGELGKPQRWRLSQEYETSRSQPPAPEDISVRRLAHDEDDVFYSLHEIWGRLLERSNLGFDEDFFEAGGDSLAAINMLAEVDSRFGSQTRTLAANFLDEPTLDNLTTLVGTARPSRPSGNPSSGLQIYPIREAGVNTRIFCVASDQEEGLYYRRLATHLYGWMDLYIVRPENTMYSRALFSIERAGEEMAALVRRAQPEGAYLLGGYCYGGIIAFEAARQLSLQGHEVRLILFDVPMPGFPTLWSYWRFWFGRARRKLQTMREEGSPKARPEGNSTSRFERIATVSELMARRLAWSAVIPIRKLLVRVEKRPLIQRFLHWAQFGNFPSYLPRPIDAQVLHFLCTDEPRVIESMARFGWRKVARRGIEEQFLPLDHSNILHESNLPGIVSTISKWCDK
jgi:oxalate---CoA ligase